ncbi:GerAB/ArcD/ProY family transporter [Acetivibrio saccincola]|uniref:GerAB/ArcD/ProY family transporter n=1 Tax=Acetivibrio saccincola TaxID=1677857 RepID=UPI00168DF1D6|nr:endospore germination permease [Acetivibrio saccincola]NLW26775.1 endospore germination permease [Acetivibrio saccincola]HQD29322.1 endospore germination permease [Acetivibrio saccincola]
MESKIVFGKVETTSLLIIVMTTQLFISFPRFVAEKAGTAGWILIVYLTVLSLFLFTIISKMYKNFQGKDIIDIGEYVGGNIGRILIGLIIIIDYMFIAPGVLREFSDSLKIITLDKTPIGFVMLFFLIGMITAAFYGIEPITRFSAIIVPIVAAAFILIIIGIIPNFNLTNLFPLMGSGVNNIFIKGIPNVSIFSGISILFILPPFLNSYDCFRKTGFYSILLSGFFLTVGALIYTLSIPYPASTEFTMPMYTLARTIDWGRFFTRIESIFVFAWAASAFIYLSILLFFIVYVFKKTFRLEYYTPLILPVSVLVFAFALIPESMMRVFQLESQIFRAYAWIVTFGMPIILLMAALLIKKKKGAVPNEKNS